MATLHYTTVDNLTAILPTALQAEFTDDSTMGDPSVKNARVETMLAAAESFAESYVTNRYSLPLTSPPQSFVHAILVIAKYHLAARRDYQSETIQRQYDEIIEWLTNIRTGALDLPDMDDQLVDDEIVVGFSDTSKQTFDRHLFNVPYYYDPDNDGDSD